MDLSSKEKFSRFPLQVYYLFRISREGSRNTPPGLPYNRVPRAASRLQKWSGDEGPSHYIPISTLILKEQ